MVLSLGGFDVSGRFSRTLFKGPKFRWVTLEPFPSQSGEGTDFLLGRFGA